MKGLSIIFVRFSMSPFVSLRHLLLLHVNFRFTTLLFMLPRNAFRFPISPFTCLTTTLLFLYIIFRFRHITFRVLQRHLSFLTFRFSMLLFISLRHLLFLYVIFRFCKSPIVSLRHSSFPYVTFCFSASLFVFRAPLVSLRHFSSFYVTHRFSNLPFVFYQTTFCFSISLFISLRHIPFFHVTFCFSTSVFVFH